MTRHEEATADGPTAQGERAFDPPTIAGVDPLSSAVFRALMRTFRLHGQLMIRILADEGAHPGQAICLRILATHDGISQRDLAEILHLSRPTVTSMLQRLERAGAITRHADEADQRLTRVYLTDAGRRLEEDLRVVLATYSRSVLDPIDAADRRELERLLGLVADNIAAALAARGEVAHHAAAHHPSIDSLRGAPR
jgi:DNA-binding MarR family transcriptional regulator